MGETSCLYIAYNRKTKANTNWRQALDHFWFVITYEWYNQALSIPALLGALGWSRIELYAITDLSPCEIWDFDDIMWEEIGLTFDVYLCFKTIYYLRGI